MWVFVMTKTPVLLLKKVQIADVIVAAGISI
jgi:hypothetical protein